MVSDPRGKEYIRLTDAKRSKDTLETIEAIKNFETLDLTGMVLYADDNWQVSHLARCMTKTHSA